MGDELRRFLRTSKDYRIEYGPFPLSGRDGELKNSHLKNIGGGGLLFHAEEEQPVGRQLVLRIFVSGWRLEGNEVIEASSEDSEALITAIAEVARCNYVTNEKKYAVAVKFLGRILGDSV